MTPLLKKLEILNIKDLVFLKTASLIWDLEKSNLPFSLSKYFIKANVIHAQESRFASSGNYRVGLNPNSFQSIGAKIFNELNEKQFFTAVTKKSFLRRIKHDFFSNY